MNYNHGMLTKYVENDSIVLDLMCGKGDCIEAIRFCKSITGVDIFDGYLDAARNKFKENTNVSFILSDSITHLKTLKDKSFDTVQCIDGIEHLSKEDGWTLLKEAERVARKYVVIFTPEGMTYNHPENAWGIPGGDCYQEHLSGWSQEDFSSRGYHLEDYTEWKNYYTGEPYHSLLFVRKQ